MKNWLNIIDISSWQTGMDLSAMFRENDLDGVIVKATGGAGYVQKTCDPWVQWLIKNDKPWGFYHFLNDDGKGAGGKAEAEFFVKHCENYFGDGIPCADYEFPATKYGTEYLYDFVEEVFRLTGCRCMIYCNLATIQEQDFSMLTEYPLWLAQYASATRRDNFDITPWQQGSFEPFPAITMHQYSGSGLLNGYKGAVDLDRFYGTREDWDFLVSGVKSEIAEKNEDETVTLTIPKNLYIQIKELFK